MSNPSRGQGDQRFDDGKRLWFQLLALNHTGIQLHTFCYLYLKKKYKYSKLVDYFRDEIARLSKTRKPVSDGTQKKLPGTLYRNDNHTRLVLNLLNVMCEDNNNNNNNNDNTHTTI